MEGPYGAFTLPKATDRKLLFFAGGIGIKPMISMLHRLMLHQRIHLLMALLGLLFLLAIAAFAAWLSNAG